MSDPSNYVVLRAGDDMVWHFVVSTPARSAEDAIRQCGGLMFDGDAESADGTYVAVPARSWKPVTVEAVQTTVLKLS